MKVQVKKKEEFKRQSVANATYQKKHASSSSFQFTDNRPEAVAQLKFQDKFDNSPQVQQAAQTSIY
jgi:hypothetical protein